MPNRTWRSDCAPIIAKVISQYKDDPKELRRQLKLAYPYGERKNHPYKVWRDEVRRQLKMPRQAQAIPDGQETLF